MMKKKRMILVSVLTIFVCLAAYAGGGQEEGAKQVIRLNAGCGHPESMAYVALFRDFFIPEVTKRVEERTGYRIEWTQAWGGSVAKLADQFESVESGLLDFAVTGPGGFEPVKTSGFALTGWLPFNSPDSLQSSIALKETMAKFPDVVKEIYYDHNILPLIVCALPNYDLITTFEWKNISDLKGKKIAAYGTNLNFLKGTGAVAVQSNLNEAYTCFQTGVYEGWIMSGDLTVDFKLNEVAPHLKKIGFGVLPFIWGMNLATWEKLPKEVQDIILEVADEYMRLECKTTDEQNQEAYDIIVQQGGTVTSLTDAQKAEWAKMLPNLPMQWVTEEEAKGYPAREILRVYIQELEKQGYKMPRNWLAE